MDRTKDVPEVTQADRNSAVRLLEAGGQDWQAKEIRLAQGDQFPIVQAFARHRTEATRPLTAEIADLRAQLGEALERIANHKPIYDYVMNVRDGNFDEPGSPYDRGRQSEANYLADIARAALAKRKQP